MNKVNPNTITPNKLSEQPQADFVGRLKTFEGKTRDVLRSRALIIAVVVVFVGVVARLLVATIGYNFDVESYLIVADIMDNGRNVYASTERYNYGPIWFQILHILDMLASHNEVIFRYLIALFLTLVDVGIFVVLWRKLGRVIACLFLLNPISIIITGYHSQFDNLAIFLGMLAVLVLDDDFDRHFSRRKLLGLFILGLSLMTKHLLFAFPLWLAIKQKGLLQKIVIMLIPIAVFLLGFGPYAGEGGQGILQNVFFYSSWSDRAYFYRLFVPPSVQMVLSSQMVWLLLLGLFAFIARLKNAFTSLLYYSALLVAVAPAITNQYLTIPIPFVSAFPNPITFLYTAVGTLFLLVDKNGLHIEPLQSVITIGRPAYYAALICLLCAALVWTVWRQNLIALFKSVVLEINIQLGTKE